MPKRIATPPPADDSEPRYLSVVHPYAISGTCNMELPKDRQDFARWVACCINKDAFFAIFHKPSSRGMVIIEINRDYQDFDRILGEHRWSEFLQNPTEEECGRATKVFYCAYNTGRIVQKNGMLGKITSWKRIDVNEDWFKGWSERNRQIKYPFPKPHFCDVPVEDRTNHPLCRPLPGAIITPPPVEIAAPQPVVGSAAWIQGRAGESAATDSKSKTLGAWGKGAPKLQTNAARPNPSANANTKRPVGVPLASFANARLPAVGGGPIVVKSSNVWSNTGPKSAPPPVATNWEDSPPISRQNTPANRAHAAPPGAGVPAKSAASGTQAVSASWGSNGASISSPDSDSGPATESDNPFAVHINFSESMEEEFHGMSIRAIDEEAELAELREFDSIAPNWDAPAADATWDDAQWDADPVDAEDLWKQNQKPEEKPALCAAHGVICKKGICAEYAKQLRLANRAKEAEERKAAMSNKNKKGRSKGRGGGKKNDENEPTERNAAQNDQFRGPGAPIKTNWRGAPRAIVSADAVEKRDTTNHVSDDGWGNSDSEDGPTAAVVTSVPADAVSAASWDVPEDAYDPWAAGPQQPAAKANPPAKPSSKKKPAHKSTWADQVDAELPAGGKADTFKTASSKRKPKRGGNSATSWGTSDAKSSTSGWGTVSDMPW